tara:strand:+ start:2604 stop:2996 length:393 start_codon:yes stop_codon:yes gene_type:complete
MSDKDYNKIAAIEKAIKEKYGDDAIANPRADWDENKEKQYLQQMKELYARNSKKRDYTEKVDVDGIKMTKKLLNRESLKNCPVCGAFSKSVKDDVSLIKFKCCNKCYIQYVEGREQRWLQGWRPNENKKT